MQSTLARVRPSSLSVRLAAIAIFTLLTALSARVTIEIGAVPITLQTFVVILSGLVLAPREAAASQLLYVGLIALGVPIDARGLGTAAFAGATAGYLIGFTPAAALTSILAHGVSQSRAASMGRRWLAGIAGMLVIYACGVVILGARLNLSAEAAWAAGVAPFLALDMVKAIVAAAIANGARAWLRRATVGA